MVVAESLGASFLLSWPLVLLCALLSPVVPSQKLFLLNSVTDRLEYGALRRTQKCTYWPHLLQATWWFKNKIKNLHEYLEMLVMTHAQHSALRSVLWSSLYRSSLL